MRIVHIAPNAPYNEGWGYQENLLPKYQAKLGHPVTLIVTNLRHEEGGLNETKCTDTISADGFRVIRRKQIRSKIPLIGKAFVKLHVFDLLMSLKPDLIFYHGLVSTTIFQATRYKERINPDCVLVQDNHLDYNIGFDPRKGMKTRFYALIYRSIYRLNDKHISRVYGVTPWRKAYAEKVFGVPSRKTDVLLMGADDEKINFPNRAEIRESVRGEHKIGKEDFLVVTGARIDKRKKIHMLMKAVNELGGVKLLVFGNVMDDVKEEFSAHLSENVKWVGWIDSDKVYDYFFAADLVFFPGQHSVLWEQACASKAPCVFGKWEGMEHVNNGGNADFLEPVTIESIKRKIRALMFTKEYFDMKEVAASEATDIYLYSVIAKKSIADAIAIMNPSSN